MLNKLQKDWRSHSIFMLLIVMMTGLFISRAILSISMISFIVLCFLHRDIKTHFRYFFASPLLWGMSLLFFLPLLSGLWSSDFDKWSAILRIKLPLLLMPMAFAGPFILSKKQWEWVGLFFIAAILIATGWSIFHYARNIEAVNESYLKAKTILTPLGDDHVRFSWLVAIAVLIAAAIGIKKMNEQRWLAIVLFVVATWLIIYLHLLAARTGLISFYIILSGFCAWLFFTKAKRKLSVALLVLLIAMPVSAYYLLPSFQNRVKYIMYNLPYFREAHYLTGSSDAVRVISIKTGWNIMQEHPLTGVGFGDVMKATNEQYAIHYPEMYDIDKILPGSEWMMYAAGNGWPGFILFTLAMLIPFFVQTKYRLLWWLINATAAFSFIFDIGLEVQYGVFVYCFVVLCCWKSLKEEKM